MSAPTLTGIRAALVATLADVGVPVYEHATPADVDTTRPWLVVHWSPGGGPEGSAIRANDLWSVAMTITVAAQSSGRVLPLPDAVVSAAELTADRVRWVLSQPAPIVTGTGAYTVAVTPGGQGGIIIDGPVANIPMDYTVLVEDPSRVDAPTIPAWP